VPVWIAQRDGVGYWPILIHRSLPWRLKRNIQLAPFGGRETNRGRRRHSTYIWDHSRTTNPIESVFATVRHRTVRTKGSLSSTTARLIVFKLVIAASKTWRRLKGTNHLPKIVAGVRFKDGIEVLEAPANHAA
jgi:hypothetical protein